MPKNRVAKIVSGALLAFILLNFPILGLFGKPYFLFGLPVSYLYVFIVWLLLIVFLYQMLRDK